MSISIPVKLDLVIVTFNRLEKLKKALSCYEKQTSPFRNLILVNNCSTDGTKEYIDEWQREKTFFGKIVIHTDENLGGSGGFYLGQKKAMELGADWVFVADDDAYAQPDMVEKFCNYIGSHDVSEISAICAAVHNLDGSLCLYHRKKIHIDKKNIHKIKSTIDDYHKESFSVDLFSYVGSFLNGCALRQVGLVNPRYFIYYDDSEHSCRLKRYGDIVVVPSMVILHEGGNETSTKDSNVIVSWRTYYFIRNEQNMLLKHFPIVGLYRYVKNIKNRLKRMIRSESTPPYTMVVDIAFDDAFWGRLGRHEKYKPGWQILKG